MLCDPAVLLAVSDATTEQVALYASLGAVGGALAAALTGFVTAYATRKSAEEAAGATLAAARTQSGATIQVAAEARFADWQNKKRDLYAEFLKLARPAAEKGVVTDGSNDPFVAQGEKLMMVAFPNLREQVRPLLSDPSPLKEPDAWTKLLDEMTNDINITPEQAAKAKLRKGAQEANHVKAGD